MRIIGLNSGLDGQLKNITGGACALIENGEIRYAVSEERISRVKYAGGYRCALNHIFNKFNLTPSEIDYYYISFYGSPFHIRTELVDYHLRDLGLQHEPHRLVVMPSHHLSHAYSSFFLSPFEEAIIVIGDNEGSVILPQGVSESGTLEKWCERNSYYWASGNNIYLIERDFAAPGEVAFGKAYNKFTRYIGFGDYHNAGKTMGLSAYDSPSTKISNVNLWEMDKQGRLISQMRETYNYKIDLPQFFAQHGVEIPPPGGPDSYHMKDYQVLASYIQHQLSKWCTAKCANLIMRSGIQNICMGGGVALNSVCNFQIEQTLGIPVFVPPYPSDEGQALGNAIYGYIHQSGLCNNPCLPKKRFFNFTYLGSEYGDDDLLEAIENYGDDNEAWHVSKPSSLECEVAQIVAAGGIVGWFQGRSEYGARALGNRSIVADPRLKETRDRVNRLKGRESFRPVAPACLAEHATNYFEGTESLLLQYMLGVVNAKPETSQLIAGIVHVDNTARLQMVTAENNSRFYGLIKAFYDITGVPMLINTSFNAAGDPIVESPADALIALAKMQLDAAAIGDHLITRGE